MLGTYLVFMPYHLCSRLGVRISSYLRHAYLLPVVTCAPMALVLLLMRRWFVPHGYKQLAIHLFAGGVVYGGCLAWAYVTGKALHVADEASIPPEQARALEIMAAAMDTLGEDV
jgi:hypothetical protein